MREGLVLRIVNDQILNGQMYNKKVHVKSIVNDYKFLAVPLGSADGGTVYSDLLERDLETVLPASSEFPKS